MCWRNGTLYDNFVRDNIFEEFNKPSNVVYKLLDIYAIPTEYVAPLMSLQHSLLESVNRNKSLLHSRGQK